MACLRLVTRLLHFHQSSAAPSSSTSFSVLGSKIDPSPRNLSVPDASLSSNEPDLELWGMMAGQGSSSLAIRNLPRHLGLDQLRNAFRSLDGFLQTRIVESSGPTIVAFIDFATNADAAKAMAANQIVMFNNQLYTTVSANEDLPTPPPSRDQEIFHPRKKVKTDSTPGTRPECQICASAIEGPHSKPCRVCRRTWCFDCVRAMFIGATHDHERMPAKCCGKVFHYGVAGGILDTVEYEIYKAKYDEFCTSNPLYCPIATCSAFIPARLMRPAANKISCHLCATSICIKCRQVSAEEHQCAPTDSNIAKIKELNYKLCPKCGTGVMKMYGCPHIRCAACGAHWCYDCSRPINTCYKRPCRGAREDGQYDEMDDGTESDTEDETTEAPRIVSSTPQWPADLLAVQAAQAVQLTAEPERLRAPQLEPLVESEPETVFIHPPAAGTGAAAEEPVNAEDVRIAQEGLRSEHVPAQDSTQTNTSTEGQVITIDSQTVVDEQISPSDAVQADRISTAASSLESSNTDYDMAPADVLFERHLRSASPSPQDSEATPRPHTTPSPATLRPASDEQTAIIVDDDENINLDDPEDHEWEADSLDFGDEPEDESWDVWGCSHMLTELRKDVVDECWMREPEKYLDCMRCFEKITFWEKEGREKGKKKEKEKVNQMAAEKEKEKKKREAKMAYSCRNCGVVYCGACREELKRLAKKERRSGRPEEV